MKYEKDIAAHVISNIALIESTRSVVDDVENTVFRQLSTFVKKHVEASDLPLGKNNEFGLLHAEEEIYFSTKNWEASYKDQIAWYCFVFGTEDEGEDIYPLSHVLGEFSKNACIRLQFVIYKDELDVNMRKFKRILNSTFLKYEELGKLGFQLSECYTGIELKFHLDKGKVAEEYPDLEDSFGPLAKALDTVFEAHIHFEKMVEEVKLLAKAEGNDVKEAGVV
jgi:hypothetical protein